MKNYRRYLDLIENVSNIGYWYFSLDDKKIFWSEGIYKIHGVTADKYTPDFETAVNFYHPDDRDSVIKIIDQTIAEKKSNSFNLRLVRPDGDIRFVESTFECQIEDGSLVALFGVFQDLTEQRKKAEEIEQSHSFLKAIIDNVPDMIFVKDKDLKLVLGNKSFWELYSEPEEELIGTTTFEKFPKEEAEFFKERDQIVFKMGEDESEENVTNAKGLTHTYMTKKVAMTRNDGEKFILGASRDITQRRIYEEQIKQYSAQLEMRNMNLERSNESLEEFAHTAAHDLKEPIRSIHNYVEMILYDHPDLDESIKDTLQKVMNVSWRMGQMVSELLLLSEINQITGEFVETDLNQVLSTEMQALGPRLEQANATVTFDTLPTIVCHPTRIGEIFRNLIVNAIKYNESEEKKVEVGYYDKDGKPVFFVKDNGIGIKNEHQGKVFKLFKRLHGKTDYGGGTGIGLAVTKKIVEMHNGGIWVESKEGKGTTFYFTLS